MKYFPCLAVLLAFVFNVTAQINMYVWSDGEKITYPILMVDSITFGEEPTPDPNASLISVTDGTFSDWDKLPAEYVITTTCHTQSRWTALKSLTVYADNNYINLLVEYDPSQITNTDNVPFHIYLNADYSAATGGFGDQWQDADTEIMLEGSIISGGKHRSYNPTIFQWAGTVGGKGWTWANIPAGHDTIGQSQMVGKEKIAQCAVQRCNGILRLYAVHGNGGTVFTQAHDLRGGSADIDSKDNGHDNTLRFLFLPLHIRVSSGNCQFYRCK